jgi:polar amino acid transport system substrate-binding protein
MKRQLRGCCLILLSLCCPPAVAESTPPTVTEKPPLYIGIPPNRPPYAYLDTQKQATGILVDAVRTTCQYLQVTCEFVSGTPDQLVQDLQAVKLNALLVVDTFIAPEVDKLQLTQPICQPKPLFIQKADAPVRSKPEDFRGTNLGVLEGSIFHIYLLDEYNSQARLKAYPFIDNAVFDLVFGRLDALFAEEALIKARITDTSLEGYLHFKVTEADSKTLPATAMVLALREQDTDLLKDMNNALQATMKGQHCAQLLAAPKTKPTKK